MHSGLFSRNFPSRNFPQFSESVPRVHYLVDVSRSYPGGVLVHARGVDGGLVACAWPALVASSLGLLLQVGQSRCCPAVGVLAGGGVRGGSFCLVWGRLGGTCSRSRARTAVLLVVESRPAVLAAAAHPSRGAAGWPLRWCFYCPGLTGLTYSYTRGWCYRFRVLPMVSCTCRC